MYIIVGVFIVGINVEAISTLQYDYVVNIGAGLLFALWYYYLYILWMTPL